MAQNYFELFGLPVQFDVDTADLSKRHRELIRSCHPDRFAQGSDAQRRAAVETSASLNDALKILRDPIDRARYFLTLRGVSTDEETDTLMEPSFLAEQLMLRERLEDADGDQVVIEDLISEVAQLSAEREQRLGLALSDGDAPALARARSLVRELQFLRRFSQELDEVHTGVR